MAAHGHEAAEHADERDDEAEDDRHEHALAGWVVTAFLTVVSLCEPDLPHGAQRSQPAAGSRGRTSLASLERQVSLGQQGAVRSQVSMAPRNERRAPRRRPEPSTTLGRSAPPSTTSSAETADAASPLRFAVGQLALMRRLESISNNVANVTHRRLSRRGDQVRAARVSRSMPDPTAFVSPGNTYLSRQTARVRQNRQSIRCRRQRRRLARHPDAGRHRLHARRPHDDDARTASCRPSTAIPILDVGGAPIQLDPNGGDAAHRARRHDHAGRQPVGALGLFTIPEQAKLTRFENSGVIPDQAAEPALDFTQVGVAQGFIERPTSTRSWKSPS